MDWEEVAFALFLVSRSVFLERHHLFIFSSFKLSTSYWCFGNHRKKEKNEQVLLCLMKAKKQTNSSFVDSQSSKQK